MTCETVEEVLAATDWKALRDGKRVLLDAITLIEQQRGETAADLLEGLLHWVGDVQDAAAREGHPVEWLTENETEKEN